MKILKDLNPKQKEAAAAPPGAVLVTAGPGSGKTKTLTHRIAYLIARDTQPYNILAVTFTNKAASEMKMRVDRLLTANSEQQTAPYGRRSTVSSQPLIGTFHSICARILRREARAIGYTSNFTIYDEEDALKLIKEIVKKISPDQKQLAPPRVRGIISSLKNNLVSPNDYALEADDVFSLNISKAYRTYQKELRGHNAMDFDDLLMKTVELFEENPKILSKYQSIFEHILIDEFQDTNLGQYKIANMLAKSRGNIYCIGDLNQSIYSFRGADYRNITHFKKDWPDAKIITLEQNYRSTQNILDVANEVIAPNKHLANKILWTEKGTGDLSVLKEVEDESEEGEFIISEIKKLAGERKLRLKDFVVLYRTNAQSRAIEESFLKNSIPYKIIGGIKFYQRKEVKDVVSWLRLCVNRSDVMAKNRASSMPKKFLTSNFKILSQKEKTKPKNQIVDILIDDFSEKSGKRALTRFLEYIIKNTGFENYLRDGTERGEERWDNIRELLSVSSKYDKQKPKRALRLFIEETSLAQETDNFEYEKDIVNLMTLHSAKGLEFPVVFIAGCEQGLLPHSRSLFGASNEELEEERRLCYVGVTRAKEKAYFTFAQSRMMFGRIQANPPSEFLRDIPEQLIDLRPAEDKERIIKLD